MVFLLGREKQLFLLLCLLLHACTSRLEKQQSYTCTPRKIRALSSKRVIICTFSYKWPYKSKFEAISRYSRAKLQTEARAEAAKRFPTAEKSRYLCTPRICGLMLLECSLGGSHFSSGYKLTFRELLSINFGELYS